MAETILDRLDADPGGARRYVASLYVIGGATHEQVAEKLAEKFAIRQPSKRIVGEWRRNDPELGKLCDELEAVKRDMSPDAAPTDVLANVPAPVDPAETTMDLFTLFDECPAFAMVCERADHDESFDVDPIKLLVDSEGESSEEFEARCEALVGDWNVHVALGADPADVERVERSMAERYPAA